MKLTEKTSNRFKSGLTLIELLVVIFILLILTSVALRVAVPATKSREMREATRTLTSFIAVAQNKAIEKGRPYGIVIARLDGEPNASLTLFYTEIPPPYAGDTYNSVCRVKSIPNPLNPANPIKFEIEFGEMVQNTTTGELEFKPAGLPGEFVRFGDTIRINYQGATYEFYDDGSGSGGGLEGYVENATNPVPVRLANQNPSHFASSHWKLPWKSTFSDPMPYQITRKPVRSDANVYQFPGSVAIDLQSSGIGDKSNFKTSTASKESILIMFSPRHGISQIYLNGNASPVSDRIYLLLGDRSKIPSINYDGSRPEEELIKDHNWKDPDSRWVTINHQTGLATVAENAIVNHSISPNTGGLFQARRIAREGKLVKGN